MLLARPCPPRRAFVGCCGAGAAPASEGPQVCGMDRARALEEVAAVARVVPSLARPGRDEGSGHVEKQDGYVIKNMLSNEEPCGLIQVDLCC